MVSLDVAQLQAVRATGLLDTPAEGRFDAITRVTCRLLQVPVSTITLLDQNRQWFKSAVGVLGKCEDPIEYSFCAHAVRQSDEVFSIRDARQDPRFRDNPLVTGDPFIRFYAGKPIHFQGQRIGTLCVIDTEPRSLSAASAQDLSDLARWVERELDSDLLTEAQRQLMSEVGRLREMALVDPLTRAWNRAGLQEIYTRESSQAARESQPLGCIMADIDHFKAINDKYGHDVGDKVLKSVADRIRASVRPYDSVGRMGGEEFMVILPKSEGPAIATVAERMRRAVEAMPIEISAEESVSVTLSLGTAFAECRPDFVPPLDRLYKAADLALYQAKSEGRNRVVGAPQPVA